MTSPPAYDPTPRSLFTACKNGFFGKCPACGKGKLFERFLKNKKFCDHCDLHLASHRADDLPAYIVIMIVGHVVVGLMMHVENAVELSLWTHAAIWPVLTIFLSLALLQPVKGALIGYQWGMKMHGFSDPTRTSPPE